MKPSSIVITGIGVTSALGNDVGTFESAIFSSLSAIHKIEDINNNLVFKMGAPLRNWDPSDLVAKKDLQTMDLFSQFAFCAAIEAIKNAKLDAGHTVNSHRVGVVIGTAGGGTHTFETQYERLYLQGKRKVSPMTVPMIMASAPASHIARLAGAKGPVFSVTSACASANHALATASSLIRDGQADIVICGGTDANFAHGNLKGWEALHAVSQDTCRPFSADRSGLILGEGAGIFVLEKKEHAARRNAPILGELLSVGMSSDAGNLVSPDPDGMYAAMRNALEIAGIAASDIDYINAHGTGTKANDAAEASAISKLLGDNVSNTPVSSTKSQLGHALGASGALELAATLGGIKRSLTPPTLNLTHLDPECPIAVVGERPATKTIKVAMSNSFAFGGLNASVIITGPEASKRR